MSSLINFYDYTKRDILYKNPNYKHHGIEIPFRACIASPGGGGKTNLLMNLICAFDDTFYKIIICVKNKSEPLYEMLEEKLNKGKSKQVEIYEDGEIPKLESGIKSGNSDDSRAQATKTQVKLPKLIVVDDLLYDNQSEIKQYYIRSRKLGYSCVYLTQSYFKMAKDIRLQCQYIFLGKTRSSDHPPRD